MNTELIIEYLKERQQQTTKMFLWAVNNQKDETIINAWSNKMYEVEKLLDLLRQGDLALTQEIEAMKKFNEKN
jgi:hypothetical protein